MCIPVQLQAFDLSDVVPELKQRISHRWVHLDHRVDPPLAQCPAVDLVLPPARLNHFRRRVVAVLREADALYKLDDACLLRGKLNICDNDVDDQGVEGDTGKAVENNSYPPELGGRHHISQTDRGESNHSDPYACLKLVQSVPQVSARRCVSEGLGLRTVRRRKIRGSKPLQDQAMREEGGEGYFYQCEGARRGEGCMRGRRSRRRRRIGEC